MNTEPTTEEEWERRINEKPPLPHHCVVCGHVHGVEGSKLPPDSLQCDDDFLVTEDYTCDRWIPPKGYKS